MHNKRLGTYGELLVATELLKLGYSVFTELGDISKKDLVVEVRSRLVGIQVKTVSKINGTYSFRANKSGPNYRYRYKVGDCDIFAVVCKDDELVVWISAQEALARSYMSFRVDPPKNNQVKDIVDIVPYLDVKRVLRDYEQDTLSSKYEGDDIVQTTTKETSVCESKCSK